MCTTNNIVRLPELLAPAGDIDILKIAIGQGADAVYIGGKRYGARAYASNFDTQEICEAIDLVHLHDKKIYLTVNTLIKESEIKDIYDYILPLYERGLDAVIIQDIGLFAFIKSHLPRLDIHISTQMAVTGINAAKLLKNMGANRIVLARELTSYDIRKIINEVDIEIETFIHGAMCYSYSGMCLFSSIVGGRSGNRGRCAQACRLPYRINDGDTAMYPISLKDMSTIDMIPQLCELGISSLKIEGRMKSAEYVGGVVATYRRRIDEYYYGKTRKTDIDNEDKKLLDGLYIREGIHNGYYDKPNGKDMVTLKSSAYKETKDYIIEMVRKNHMKQVPDIAIYAIYTGMVGTNMRLDLFYKDYHACSEGSIVETALNMPTDKDTITRQLSKLGGSGFIIEDIELYIDDNIFVPISSINQLRREAINNLRNSILESKRRMIDICSKNNYDSRNYLNDINVIKDNITSDKNSVSDSISEEKTKLHICCNAREQIRLLEHFKCIDRIYINYSIIDNMSKCEIDNFFDYTSRFNCECFIKLPMVDRGIIDKSMASLIDIIKSYRIAGVLVSNLESLQRMISSGYKGKISLDHPLYMWNNYALKELSDICMFDTYTLPYELHYKDMMKLNCECAELVIYGRIPMMISTNNPFELNNNKVNSDSIIYDRLNNAFPIVSYKKYCYNIMYNFVPISLHDYMEIIDKMHIRAIRLDFTIESYEECMSIINGYIMMNASVDYKYTVGNFNKGVL